MDTPDAKDANSVYVTTPLPEVGTFTRWVSKDDNNMRDCYLWALRLTDYLRSRPDVGTIYLRGASRTGPVQFVNAALDPTKISAVDIHVSTSCGISWQDKVYQGWGMRPRDITPEKWYEMSAYYDPVNFAPDMKAPFINAGGISDDLAPRARHHRAIQLGRTEPMETHDHRMRRPPILPKLRTIPAGSSCISANTGGGRD